MEKKLYIHQKNRQIRYDADLPSSSQVGFTDGFCLGNCFMWKTSFWIFFHVVAQEHVSTRSVHCMSLARQSQKRVKQSSSSSAVLAGNRRWLEIREKTTSGKVRRYLQNVTNPLCFHCVLWYSWRSDLVRCFFLMPSKIACAIPLAKSRGYSFKWEVMNFFLGSLPIDVTLWDNGVGLLHRIMDVGRWLNRTDSKPCWFVRRGTPISLLETPQLHQAMLQKQSCNRSTIDARLPLLWRRSWMFHKTKSPCDCDEHIDQNQIGLQSKLRFNQKLKNLLGAEVLQAPWSVWIS